MSNFFQTNAWRDFQIALGNNVEHGAGEGWHYWGRHVSDSLGKYLYLPYGPVVTDEAALDAAIEDAKHKAKSAGAYRLVVEPSLPITREIASEKFTKELIRFQPSRTQTIDLTQDEDLILKGMNATRRKQFRGAERKGMTFAESHDRADYDAGVELLRISGDEKSFEVRDDRYFDLFWKHLVEPGLAKIFVAKLHGETQVVAFVIDDEDTRYYLYVGRDLGNNSLQVSSPFITYMILDAKERGLNVFDLFGISRSDDIEDETTGYTVFKRTFGGETVQYAGTWETGVRPVTYGIRRILNMRASAT